MKLMPTSPLFTHPQSASVIAWRNGDPISAGRFLADVAQLRQLLPAGGHMLNACVDRYRFMVGLAAALTSNKVSLLPSTHTPEMLRHLRQFAADAFCLTDGKEVSGASSALPQIQFPELRATAVDPAAFSVPAIEDGRLVAMVFTSGSTGIPVPHQKTWGSLVHSVRAEAQLCGLLDGRQHAIVGTVPAQHMYGFESTVLMAWQSGSAAVASPTFYPADICDAVRSVPRPRLLVSTPLHLRAVIGVELEVPAVDLLLSATAPLSRPLAQQLEGRFQAPLLEIYGCTETGQIAVRQSTKTPEWRLFPGVRLNQQDGITLAAGAHIAQPTPLNDVIEPLDDTRFLLHGRTADLVNIAGKRNSLAYLDLQLQAIDGVVDAAFYMPDEAAPQEGAPEAVMRLTAFVVAPGLDPTALTAALRERIDPVFLPRPLVFVDALPRNATGKLPRAALKQLAREYQAHPSRSTHD